MELINVLCAGFDPNVLHQAYKEEIKAGCLCFNNWWIRRTARWRYVKNIKDTGIDIRFPAIIGHPTCIIVNEEHRIEVHNIKEMLDDYYKQNGVHIPILYSVTNFGYDPIITAQLITRIKEIKEHFTGHPFVLIIRTEHDQIKFYRSLYSYIYGMAKYRTIFEKHNVQDEFERQIMLVELVEKEKQNMQDDLERQVVLVENEKENMQDDFERKIILVKEEKQNMVNNMVNNLERQIVLVEKEKQNMRDDLERQIILVEEEKQNMVNNLERQIGLVKKEKQNIQDDLESVRRELGSSIRKGDEYVRKLYNETTSHENTMRELMETKRKMKLITEENEKLIAILKANGLEMETEGV